MPSPTEKSICCGGGARVSHAGQATEAAHYLRQATITLRRRSSWLHQMWCRNRQPNASEPTWKH